MSSASDDLLSILPFILENLDSALAFEIAIQIYLRTNKEMRRDCQLAMLKRSIQTLIVAPSFSMEDLFSRIQSVFRKALKLEDLAEILESFANVHPKSRPSVFKCLSGADNALPPTPSTLKSKLKRMTKKIGLADPVYDSLAGLIRLSGVFGGREFFNETEERLDQDESSPMASLFDILLSIVSMQGRLPTVWAYQIVHEVSCILDEECLEILFSSIHNPNVEESIIEEENSESDFDNFDQTSSSPNNAKENENESESEAESLASEDLEIYERKLAEMFRIKKQQKEGNRIKKESEAAFKSKIWELLAIISSSVNTLPHLAHTFLIHLCRLPNSLLVTNQFSKVVANLDFISITSTESEWTAAVELIVKRSFSEPAVLVSIWAALRRTLFRSPSRPRLSVACKMLWDNISSPACRAKYFEILSSSQDTIFKDFTSSELLGLLKEPLAQFPSEKKPVRQACANLVLKILSLRAADNVFKTEWRPVIRSIANSICGSIEENKSSSALREHLRPLLNIVRKFDDRNFALEVLQPIHSILEKEPRFSNSRAEIRKLMHSD